MRSVLFSGRILAFPHFTRTGRRDEVLEVTRVTHACVDEAAPLSVNHDVIGKQREKARRGRDEALEECQHQNITSAKFGAAH